MKRLIALTLTLFMLLALFGCNTGGTPSGTGESGTSGASSEAPIKLAFLFPLSGPNANTGEDAQLGFKSAIKYINENGGVKSMDGRQIEVIYADTMSTEEGGATEAERLINNEGVVAIAGCYNGNVTGAVQVVCEKYHVPLMLTCSVDNFLSEGEHPYSFSIHEWNSLLSQQQLSVIELANELVPGDISTAALLVENSTWSTTMVEMWSAGLAKLGVEIVINDVVAPGASDMSTTVSKLVSANPDVIINALGFENNVMLTETMVGKNWMPKLWIGSSAGETDADFIPTVGAAANGFITVSGWSFDIMSAKGNTWVNDVYVADWGEDINPESVAGWTAAWIIYEGLESAGSSDPEAITTAIRNGSITSETEWNPYPFDFVYDPVSGRNDNAICTISQFQDEKVRIIFPEEFRADGVEFIYPGNSVAPIN